MNNRIRTGLNSDSVIPKEYHRYQPTFARSTEREAMECLNDRKRAFGRRKEEDDDKRRWDR